MDFSKPIDRAGLKVEDGVLWILICGGAGVIVEYVVGKWRGIFERGKSDVEQDLSKPLAIND